MKPSIRSLFTKGNIKIAKEFANKCHHLQMRKSGEPYINHCFRVAQMAKHFHLGRFYEIAAVLHDTVECSPTDCQQELTELFGREITELVISLSKESRKEIIDQFGIDTLTTHNSLNKTTFNSESLLLNIRLERYIDRLKNGFKRFPAIFHLKMIDQIDNLKDCGVFKESRYYTFIHAIQWRFIPLYIHHQNLIPPELQASYNALFQELAFYVNSHLESGYHIMNRKHRSRSIKTLKECSIKKLETKNCI